MGEWDVGMRGGDDLGNCWGRDAGGMTWRGSAWRGGLPPEGIAYPPLEEGMR